MRPQVRAFRDAAVPACWARGFPFREFMVKWGLEDILEEAEEHNLPAKVIAARVLTQCCLTDGKFNNFQVGLLAVMTFPNNHFGPLGQGEKQAFRDLVNILFNQGTPETVRRWLDSHYP